MLTSRALPHFQVPISHFDHLSWRVLGYLPCRWVSGMPADIGARIPEHRTWLLKCCICQRGKKGDVFFLKASFKKNGKCETVETDPEPHISQSVIRCYRSLSLSFIGIVSKPGELKFTLYTIFYYISLVAIVKLTFPPEWKLALIHHYDITKLIQSSQPPCRSRGTSPCNVLFNRSS